MFTLATVLSALELGFIYALVALALFLTLVLPILLLLFLCLFKKISPLPMALGLLSFFISQILLRIPLLLSLIHI